MAQIVKGFVFSKRAGRGSIRPWAEWLDGQCRRLTPADFGKDEFPKHIKHQCGLAAKKVGKLVRCEFVDGKKALMLEAYKPGENGEPEAPKKGGKGKKAE
jgi:hypothetical protein